MKKIKILAVAPYEGLGELMKKASFSREDIDLHVYTGDLSAGVELAVSIQDLEKFDIIISRGGTAEMLQEVVPIPVVEIKLTEYDLMRSIKLAQSYIGNFAIVGFPNITSRINKICDFMQFQIDTFTVKSDQEAEETINKLHHLGYSLLVGDAVTVSKAHKKGLNGILITSGKESVEEAFDEAIKIVKYLEISKTQSDVYKNTLNNCPLKILIFNKNYKLVYSNLPQGQNELNKIYSKLIPYIDKIVIEKKLKFMLKADPCVWNVTGILNEKSTENYITFYINIAFYTPALEHDFYTVQNAVQQEDFSIINFYLSYNLTREILDRVSKVASTRLPLLIYGENGTGKDSIAYHAYLSSEDKNQSFLIIDCKKMTDKQLSSLLYNDSSPLTENETVVYFQSIHWLNEDKQSKLVNYIEDSFLHKRNRVIYSTGKSLKEMNKDILVDYLTGNSAKSVVCVTIPPLRELRTEIPSLTSIYISMLNLELGQQVAGVSEDAMKLLKNFSWHLNFYQFINVLKKLILVTDTTLIQEDETRKILEEETRLFSSNRTDTNRITGTLDDITSNIIQQVLEEEGMNQSQTAKRLGISRSTLWRKLKIEPM